MCRGRVATPDDINEFLMFAVRLTLCGVGVVHESWVLWRVSIGSAGERRELAFQSHGVRLKLRAFTVACEADALASLGSASEAGPHRRDVIVFADRSFVAHGA